MNKKLIVLTVIIIISEIFVNCNAVAQVRIDEPELANELQQQREQMLILGQKTQSQEQLIQTQQQQLQEVQQQLQSLSQEADVLAQAMQSEKVNAATNISILNGNISQMESQIMSEINDRLEPINQVLQISGSQVTLQAQGGLIIQSGSSISIGSPAKISLTSGVIEGDAPLAKFAGIIRGDTIHVTYVISANYTPGAGNIW